MKILSVHADFIEYAATKKALQSAEEVSTERVRVDECLVIFSAVEKADEQHQRQIVEKLVKEISNIAEQVKAKTIVLYPYAHLSSSLSNPATAIAVLKESEKALKKTFKVFRAPFGWYKTFTIQAKGHPLSELSREITAEDAGPVAKGTDHKYTLEKKKPSAQQALTLTAAAVVAKTVKAIYDVKIGTIGLHHDRAYVDVFGAKLRNDDLARIEKQAKKTLREIKSITISKKQPGKEDTFQHQLANDLGKQAKVYDVAGTPLVPLYENPFTKPENVGLVKVFSLGGAYWRNHATNEQLTRIYVGGFKDNQAFASFRKQQEEAEKRDHKTLGRELDLFSVHEEAPGMPFFHDNGFFIVQQLTDFMTSEMKKRKYQLLKTPLIMNKKLWLQSGHWDHYSENMYFTKIDKQDFAVKPMNCPGHMLIYKNDVRSYRELPLKLGEFGIVHRHELSGVLNGLFRVRFFTQDDAHVYCTPDQLQEQIIELIDLIDIVYKTFGFTYKVELSTKPPKAMGDPKIWDVAEKALADAMNKKKMDYTINAGDGAFYGPKLDFHIKDAMGRSWQCGTIQLDFSMPERFELNYEGSDSRRHTPIMLHRAIYGSLERFIGILIEHFAGKFPLWISPKQVSLVTVTDRSEPFAKEVYDQLHAAGFRVDLDARAETIGKKVRDAQVMKTNYIVTIGDQEVEKKTLAVRDRAGKVTYDVPVDKFITDLVKEKAEKRL